MKAVDSSKESCRPEAAGRAAHADSMAHGKSAMAGCPRCSPKFDTVEQTLTCPPCSPKFDTVEQTLRRSVRAALTCACTSFASCAASSPPPSDNVTATLAVDSVPNQPEKAQSGTATMPAVLHRDGWVIPSSSHAPPLSAARAAPRPSDVSRATASPGPLGGEQMDPDGNDDPVSVGQGPFPTTARFERVGRAPLSLRQICDLTPFGDALYAVHSLNPLGADGATISRYRPSDGKHAFATVFDWNRAGEPAKGGGAGQGFLRIRAIGGRLFVPDADPPYNGFGLMDWGTEGYVFVSSPEGKFAYAMRPHYRPPGRPTREGRGGAMVIPRAYHDFDVIRFRGHLLASTGAVPPKQRAWYGPSPGALHVATEDLSHFEYALSYPEPYLNGVWRLTYLIRFRDRLYVGIQDYDGRAPHDYVVLAPPAGEHALRQQDMHPVRVSFSGAAQTLRWYAHDGRLYWIAWGRDGVRLRVTSDGEHWSAIELPQEAGAPTDVTAFRGELVLLAERGLYRLDGQRVQSITTVLEHKSPFELRDALCAAPLAVFDNELYAGGQRDGSLYRLVID